MADSFYVEVKWLFFERNVVVGNGEWRIENWKLKIENGANNRQCRIGVGWWPMAFEGSEITFPLYCNLKTFKIDIIIE